MNVSILVLLDNGRKQPKNSLIDDNIEKYHLKSTAILQCYKTFKGLFLGLLVRNYIIEITVTG